MLFKTKTFTSCKTWISQSRRFTHIQDTIKIVMKLGKKINRGTIASQIKKLFNIISCETI